MSSFKDKNVLITVGTGGIGLLIAIRGIKEEANAVITWDNNPGNIEFARSVNSEEIN